MTNATKNPFTQYKPAAVEIECARCGDETTNPFDGGPRADDGTEGYIPGYEGSDDRLAVCAACYTADTGYEMTTATARTTKIHKAYIMPPSIYGDEDTIWTAYCGRKIDANKAEPIAWPAIINEYEVPEGYCKRCHYNSTWGIRAPYGGRR